MGFPASDEPWREGGRPGSGHGEAFSNDLRLQIFRQESLLRALAVLEKSAQTGATMENRTPQAGEGGHGEGPVAAVEQD